MSNGQSRSTQKLEQPRVYRNAINGDTLTYSESREDFLLQFGGKGKPLRMSPRDAFEIINDMLDEWGVVAVA